MQSSSVVFSDPWVNAFQGEGVRCYLDVVGDVCRPTAVLPSFGSTGTSPRCLAEWFSVAASTTARGMRVVTSQPVHAAASPRSVVEEPESRSASPPVAYTPAHSELASALVEVARAIRGRELPYERADRNDGYCYLSLVRDDFKLKARARFGAWPVFCDLAIIPLEWLKDPGDCVSVGVSVRGGNLHFQDGGGDGLLTAYDLLVYARAGLTRARGPASQLPEAIMLAKVGGVPAWSDERPESAMRSAVSPQVIVSPCDEVSGEASCGADAPRGPSSDAAMLRSPYPEGYCYLSLFLPEARSEVERSLGAWPPAWKLIGFPQHYYAPDSVLSQCMVCETGHRLHVGFGPVVSLTAKVFLDYLRRVRCLANFGASGVYFMVVGGSVASWRDLPTHRDEGLPCVARLLLDVWGRPALRVGSDLQSVFPREVLARMPDQPALTLPVTLVQEGGHVCIHTRVRSGCDEGHMTLAEAFEWCYSSGLPLCRPVVAPVGIGCNECGFQVSEGHEYRCRPGGVRTNDQCRRDAWIGDALHVLDVRRAVVQAGVPVHNATLVAQDYLAASSQEAYVKAFYPNFARGRTTRQVSTWFEANYASVLRGEYREWLSRRLTA